MSRLEFFMSNPDSLDFLEAAKKRESRRFPWLGLGLAISLGVNAYLLIRADHQARDVASLDQRLQGEITRLSDATSAAFDVDQQRFLQMKTQMGTPGHTPYAGQDQLADAATNTDAQPAKAGEKPSPFHQPDRKPPAVSAEAKPAPEARQAPEAKPSAEPKRIDTTAMLRAGSAQMNTLQPTTAAAKPSAPTPAAKMETPVQTVASKPPDVAPAKAPSEAVSVPTRSASRPVPVAQRVSLDFDLVKDKTGQTFGNVRIALKKSDTKHNIYTIQIFTENNMVEKKDQAANERIQIPVAGASQPYEVIVREIRKDEVLGSLSIPNPSAGNLAARGSSAE
jgi:hypothetical protein